MSQERTNRAPAELKNIIERRNQLERSKPEVAAQQIERTVGRIQERMGAFQASTEADIDILLNFDHSERTAATDKAYRESINNIRENQDIIIDLIRILNQSNQESAGPIIASLQTLHEAVEDSLAGNTYRKDNSLSSAEKQVGEYLTAISQLKGDDEINPAVLDRFSQQPDIIDMYHLGEQESDRAREILGPNYSAAEVFGYVENLSGETVNPITEWTQEHCDNVLQIIKATENLGELAIFRKQAEAQLAALNEKIRTSMEELTGLDLTLLLVEQLDNIPEGMYEEVDQMVTRLEGLLFSSQANELNGWLTINPAYAEKTIQLAKTAISKFSVKNTTDLMNEKVPKKLQNKQRLNERMKLDACVNFFGLVQTQMEKLKTAQDQIKKMTPILRELGTTVGYVQVERTTPKAVQSELSTAA